MYLQAQLLLFFYFIFLFFWLLYRFFALKYAADAACTVLRVDQVIRQIFFLFIKEISFLLELSNITWFGFLLL